MPCFIFHADFQPFGFGVHGKQNVSFLPADIFINIKGVAEEMGQNLPLFARVSV